MYRVNIQVKQGWLMKTITSRLIYKNGLSIKIPKTHMKGIGTLSLAILPVALMWTVASGYLELHSAICVATAVCPGSPS